jgi:hypothetical protein
VEQQNERTATVRKVFKALYYCSWVTAAYFFVQAYLHHELPWRIWGFRVSAGVCILIYCILAYPYFRSKIRPNRES